MAGLFGGQPALQPGQLGAVTLFLLTQLAGILLQTAALLAAGLQLLLLSRKPLLQSAQFGVKLLQQLRPLQHTLLLVRTALQAEKTATQPAAVAGDQAMSGRQVRQFLQRLGKTGNRQHMRQPGRQVNRRVTDFSSSEPLAGSSAGPLPTSRK